ncbi:MAG TPA: chromate efflux transporter [Thermoanaerobaculia bacterium]|nr:chromate efflux transporter [Thermoanaerobaculia bacterium]
MSVGFWEAFRYWLRLGFISFGGPAGQIAIMQRDLVDRKRWISQERFLHALSYCMLLPGPEAQQLAIYIGWLLHGTWGGIVAGAFFVIPSVFILWGLSAVYAAYGSVPAVAGILAGLKPAVVALVVVALVKIGRRALSPRGLVAVSAAAFVGIYVVKIPFPWIVIGAGVVGFLAGRIWRRAFARAPIASTAEESLPATAQSRERIARAQKSWPRFAKIAAAGILLWGAPFLVLGLLRGWSSLHVLQYRFFTQAAFVTFGGAYAVLAYVTQAAVQSYHWITQAQAIDGLGLAETTPGPLIMVLQFVGFMSGWNRPEGMGRLASASLGALVTTYVTFLPCFFYIFLGAPYVEGLRGNRSLTAALSGITAAVVGVILNLAVLFGLAVVLPGGWGHAPDWFALVLTAGAFAALQLFEVDAIWVVLAGGAVGLAWTLLK